MAFSAKYFQHKSSEKAFSIIMTPGCKAQRETERHKKKKEAAACENNAKVRGEWGERGRETVKYP